MQVFFVFLCIDWQLSCPQVERNHECWGIVCAVCEHDNYYRSRLNLNMHLLIHSLAQKQIQYSSNWIK